MLQIGVESHTITKVNIDTKPTFDITILPAKYIEVLVKNSEITMKEKEKLIKQVSLN